MDMRADVSMPAAAGSIDTSLAVDAAASVAARFAAAVDLESRFPSEAIAAVKEHRLLGIQVPPHLGGEGAGLAEVMRVCFRLGRACASTGMVFAMHQIMVACILRHSAGSSWHSGMLQRLCEEQLLLASSTTEGTSGGNVRSSEAPVESKDDGIQLLRRATVMSYGAEADGIVTTARRSADVAPSDQVLAVFLKKDYSLEPLSSWDTMGMRGTCSTGYVIRAAGSAEQLLPEPYEKIHALTMVPYSHLSWASVWAGIAAGALDCTQRFLRQAARHSGGQLPPGAAHFTRASASLLTLRGLLASSLKGFERIQHDELALRSIEFQMSINLTKVEASELAVGIVLSALRACGLSGYRNDGEFSVARHLRDVLSSPIMINNDRILSNLGTTALMSGIPTSIL